MNNFGKNLKYLRKLFNVNQSGIGLEVNKGHTTIGNWENGVSEPGLADLIGIGNFFGVNLDALIKADLEKGNLISEEHVAEFKLKGNLKGNPIGNLKGAKAKFYDTAPSADFVVNEAEQVTLWLVLKEMKQLSSNVEGLRADILKKAAT